MTTTKRTAKAAPAAAVAAATTTPTFVLGAKVPSPRATLQAGGKTGLGKGWRAVATAKPNSRAIALDALMAIPAPFTMADALAALATVKDSLGSGTPRSYYMAFVACGYITPAVA